MSYYKDVTGEVFKSQCDTPNRVKDRKRVETTHNISEEGNDYTIFRSKLGLRLAKRYTRICYGDHGPYIEFLPKHIIRTSWHQTYKAKATGWYHICQPNDGSYCKLYVQIKSVSMLRNPPAGRYSCHNNRSEGYADYRVDRLYISPDEITI